MATETVESATTATNQADLFQWEDIVIEIPPPTFLAQYFTVKLCARGVLTPMDIPGCFTVPKNVFSTDFIPTRTQVQDSSQLSDPAAGFPDHHTLATWHPVLAAAAQACIEFAGKWSKGQFSLPPQFAIGDFVCTRALLASWGPLSSQERNTQCALLQEKLSWLPSWRKGPLEPRLRCLRFICHCANVIREEIEDSLAPLIWYDSNPTDAHSEAHGVPRSAICRMLDLDGSRSRQVAVLLDWVRLCGFDPVTGFDRYNGTSPPDNWQWVINNARHE
eukprot:TRINITY_DN3189_c0_g4_i1.p1 TRINITY_DN3189_c0_g4~~TRINITY_DN3189_c0_g4_i1.p1  ORF type:complete len:276 (-),score=11.67 TRINITY_DN3189_c0_g4_i1:315-1142(-)